VSPLRGYSSSMPETPLGQSWCYLARSRRPHGTPPQAREVTRRSSAPRSSLRCVSPPLVAATCPQPAVAVRRTPAHGTGWPGGRTPVHRSLRSPPNFSAMVATTPPPGPGPTSLLGSWIGPGERPAKAEHLQHSDRKKLSVAVDQAGVMLHAPLYSSDAVPFGHRLHCTHVPGEHTAGESIVSPPAIARSNARVSAPGLLQARLRVHGTVLRSCRFGVRAPSTGQLGAQADQNLIVWSAVSAGRRP